MQVTNNLDDLYEFATNSNTSSTTSTTTILTDEHFEEFKANGVVVVENVFSEQEINSFRTDFHQQLLSGGFDHQALLSHNQSQTLPGVRLKSPAASIFYNKWKLIDIALEERVVSVLGSMLRETFAQPNNNEILDNHDVPLYNHPFGNFNHVLSYIDRCCYRLPDSVRAEGGLSVHLDRNVNRPYENLVKWRPIQAFVALTDQFGADSGGLRVTRQFHREISGYDFRQKSESEKGEFHRIHPNQHHQLVSACQPVDCPAGSIVMWDNRLPHATASRLSGADTREVVYVGVLPDVPLNQHYVEQQADALRKNAPPPAYINDAKATTCDRNWTLDDNTILTPFKRSLLML